MLVKEPETGSNNYDFASVYHITEELECGRKSLDGPVKDVNGRFRIQNDE